MEFLRYRIITASAPWVAAEDAPCGEDEALDGAVLAEGLEAVLGACGGESAAWGLEGGYAHLIESDEHHEGP